MNRLEGAVAETTAAAAAAAAAVACDSWPTLPKHIVCLQEPTARPWTNKHACRGACRCIARYKASEHSCHSMLVTCLSHACHMLVTCLSLYACMALPYLLGIL
jgi:hypothetical protein